MNNKNGRTIRIIKSMLNETIHEKPHAWTLEDISKKIHQAGISTTAGQLRQILEKSVIYADGTFVSCVNRGIKACYYREFRYMRKASL